jgi:hypothetical protein
MATAMSLMTCLDSPGNMKNKQPYYHRVEALLFTATQPLTEQQFLLALRKALIPLGLIPTSLEIESQNHNGILESGWHEPEPGNPSDLT